MPLTSWASGSLSKQKNLVRIPGSSEGSSSRGPEEETGSSEDRVRFWASTFPMYSQTNIITQSNPPSNSSMALGFLLLFESGFFYVALAVLELAM
jgi:hypothetical protein